ncbi:hypothetical protein EON81_03095 [bacterium]|nr:MAG: hypothetical protein EON81_03095 [bacterium]
MSVLRRFRHLHDIPGLVDVEEGSQDWWLDDSEKTQRIVSDRLRRRSEAWTQSERAVSWALRSYVNNAQHDSHILGHIREGGRFTLTASDEHTEMLAQHGFDAVSKEAHYPFDLVFEGVSFVGWRLREKDGTLRWAPPPQMGELAQWLLDCFIEPERPGVRWAVVFYQWDGRYSRRVLLVEAESLRVVERQRAAWIQYVGGASLPVFDESQTRRRETSLVDPKVLREFLREHGLPHLNPLSGD